MMRLQVDKFYLSLNRILCLQESYSEFLKLKRTITMKLKNYDKAILALCLITFSGINSGWQKTDLFTCFNSMPAPKESLLDSALYKACTLVKNHPVSTSFFAATLIGAGLYYRHTIARWTKNHQNTMKFGLGFIVGATGVSAARYSWGRRLLIGGALFAVKALIHKATSSAMNSTSSNMPQPVSAPVPSPAEPVATLASVNQSGVARNPVPSPAQLAGQSAVPVAPEPVPVDNCSVKSNS
jgi:hypothetical protein